jgi:hypothetical protein
VVLTVLAHAGKRGDFWVSTGAKLVFSPRRPAAKPLRWAAKSPNGVPCMKNLSSWIQKISKGWMALASLIIFVLFTAFVLPKQASLAESGTGNSKSPDMSFVYTSDDLYQLAQAYGETGRISYIKARFSFDLIWPVVYMIFLTTGISWLFQRVFRQGSLWQLANVMPLCGMILDYLENISTSVVMIRYPDPTAVVDIFAPIFTLTKWLFVGGSFVLLLFGLIVWIWQLIGKKVRMK